MTDPQSIPDNGEDAEEQDILAVYGEPGTKMPDLVQLADRRREFQPWHHPVKQIVRARQWAALTKRLLAARTDNAPRVLRYFTLPGADLLDIRVLASVCEPLGVKIDYFGFDSTSSALEEGTDAEGASAYPPASASWVAAESALRQAGRITPDAVIHADRLEDIALADSHAAMQLSQRGTFDVINIDACDHLAYCPKGRARSTFDALEALLKHQIGARSPWLLFITTRAEPKLLGEPGILFQDAITQNLRMPQSNFGASLASCLGADEGKLATELASVWGTHDIRFLKLYSIGLGKFLLQWFHAQPNLPANVELASIYSYHVYGQHPDMLALAFRITPDPPKFFSPNVGGGAAVIPFLEPTRAAYVVTQAVKLQDLDQALETDAALRTEAVDGTKALLHSGNYDVDEWCKWLAGHERRPMVVT
jgi:hypothetical protein